VYISVRLIRHPLIRKFAQFVTSFYLLEVIFFDNASFAVSFLMFNKLGIFVWELLHLAICLSNLYTRREAWPESPLRERGSFCSFLKI